MVIKMIVNVIKPQGFCLGVAKALKLVEETIQDSSIPRPIYLLGRIIHNDIVIEKIKEQGVIILDKPNKSKQELLNEIHQGSVIFSAHGVEPKIYEIAQNNGLHIIDASCKYVLSIQEKIKNCLNDNYDVIYIGTKGHPESEAVMGISDKIHFVSKLDEIDSLIIQSSRIFAANQTTLSIYDLEDLLDALKKKFPKMQYDDTICMATTLRQKAMVTQPNADLCIVVGDKKSSNTKKLVEVSQRIAKIPTILISSVDELNKEILDGKNVVNISSGASTPKAVTDEVISFLNLYK